MKALVKAESVGSGDGTVLISDQDSWEAPHEMKDSHIDIPIANLRKGELPLTGKGTVLAVATFVEEKR